MPAVPSPTLGSKRESPSVLLGPPARRHRPIGVESPSADSPQTTARDPPAPTSISIQSILRQNCRMRLYVQPIAWTSTHLRLLELRFLPVKREGREQTQPPSGNINGTPDSTVDDIALRSQEQKRFDVPDMIVAVDRLRSRYLESKKYTTREILAHCNIHLE
ncbi:hypothetical protein N7461_006987 [Penicillium sp. DV-2018c]|nr:hypothetical protein N7461_006987 [Penicillium sp. DV-2018c]